jgi:hypothetical protein
VLDFDGRPDEAVTLWEGGLTGAADDFPLLMSVGEIRGRQGADGPTMVYRRGVVGAMPSKDKAGEGRYKRSRLAEAATAYADTLLDLALGMLGGLIAAILVARLPSIPRMAVVSDTVGPWT